MDIDTTPKPVYPGDRLPEPPSKEMVAFQYCCVIIFTVYFTLSWFGG